MNDLYAAAGVDYRDANPFRDAMRAMARRTHGFPTRWNIVVEGRRFRYIGPLNNPPFVPILEGVGRKPLIAEIMNDLIPDPRWYADLGRDLLRAAEIDCLREEAYPFALLDYVLTDYYKRLRKGAWRETFIDGLYEACRESSVALMGGETAAAPDAELRAPEFAVALLGIAARQVKRMREGAVRTGAVIVGVRAPSMNVNGASHLIKLAAALDNGFLTVLPVKSTRNQSGTLGEEALIPPRSYLNLAVRLFRADDIDILAWAPATGGGVAKLSLADPLPFFYRIRQWIDPLPPIFQFLRTQNLPLGSLLRIYNWGIGLYLIVAPKSVDRVLDLGKEAGDELDVLGEVEASGKRKVIFEPYGGIELPPPGT